MKRNSFLRLIAAALSLLLVITPAAQALTVQQAAELIQEFYVDDVPQSVLEQETIESMVSSLGDPYTQYFTPAEYQDFIASMSDTSLVGIGIVFQVTENGLLVNQVLDNSPAQQGGLAEGDLIIAVDDHNVLGADTETITGWIQGNADTPVAITYLREGKKTTVTLTRALVVVPATTTELIDGHIGYIRCTTFGDETVGHFKDGIEACRDQATVWIVDLRSNLGGSTEAATEAAGLFTGPGEMAYLRDGADEYGAYYHADPSVTLYPVIVLVDYYSASASEIFAAAIRDRSAGIVIGTRTYGKGVAQIVLDQTSMPEYFPDGDAIKITAYRFFSPEGNTSDQVGVIPDLMVSPDDTLDIACLLAAGSPGGNTKGYLRADLTWRWYIDLSVATAPENKAVFARLLNAIPDNKKIWLGTSGPTGWQSTSPAELFELYHLDGYQPPFFFDQDDSDFYTALSVLKTYGMVQGRSDGNFYPQDTLTRAELCQLLAVILNCDVPTNKSPYSDVSDDAWYAPAVIAMSNLGFVKGTGNNQFSPEAPVDHQQFITIMGHLAQWLNLYLYNTAVEMPNDAVNIVGLMEYADWAKPDAWLLSFSQHDLLGRTVTLLWDSADEISPLENTTRDEAAYTIYHLLSFIGILPA